MKDNFFSTKLYFNFCKIRKNAYNVNTKIFKSYSYVIKARNGMTLIRCYKSYEKLDVYISSKTLLELALSLIFRLFLIKQIGKQL